MTESKPVNKNQTDKLVKVIYKNKGRQVTCTGLIIGCDPDIGLTIINAEDKDDFLVCLIGPLAPNASKDHPDYSNGNYERCYADYIKRIASGTVNLDLHDRAIAKIGGASAGSNAGKSTCAFGQ